MGVCAKILWIKWARGSGETPPLIILVLSPTWLIHSFKTIQKPLKRLFLLFKLLIIYHFFTHSGEKGSLIHWPHGWHWAKRFTCLFILSTALQERYHYLLTYRWGNVHSEIEVAGSLSQKRGWCSWGFEWASPSYLPGQCFWTVFECWQCIMFLFQP